MSSAFVGLSSSSPSLEEWEEALVESEKDNIFFNRSVIVPQEVCYHRLLSVLLLFRGSIIITFGWWMVDPQKATNIQVSTTHFGKRSRGIQEMCSWALIVILLLLPLLLPIK